MIQCLQGSVVTAKSRTSPVTARFVRQFHLAYKGVTWGDSQKQFLAQLNVDFLCMLQRMIFSAVCTFWQQMC